MHKTVVSVVGALFAAGMLGSGVIFHAKPPENPGDPPAPVPTPVAAVPRGTVGDALPPIYDRWWLRPSDKGATLISLTESSEYRTNVMFTWVGSFSFKIDAIDANGTPLGSLSFSTYQIEPCSAESEPCSGMYQVNRLANVINPLFSGMYTLQITPTGGTGKIFFYATAIDNKSGDFILYTQFRTTKANNMWSQAGLYYQGSIDAETEEL